MAPIDNALVIGGGIGGMCAAIELAKLGIAVDLVELNPHWAPDGAGITISGPTLRALRQIGVAGDVLAAGGSWDAIDICSAAGELMATAPLAPAAGADGLPRAAGIMRPVLAEILARATLAAGVRVRLGLTFETIAPDAGGTDVRFADGARGRYGLVVGADGLHSKVRAFVKPGFEGPRFMGQGVWRAVVPRTRANSTIFMGRSTKAGLNPVSATESYLFLLDRREGLDFVEPTPAGLAEVIAEFGGAVGEIRRGLEDGTLAEPRILYRPLQGHCLAAPWHAGRVVLLGDAVHATTPHLASGAGIAVEAALVLAQELARAADVEAALGAYAQRHHDRAALVVNASARMGELEREGGSKDEHQHVMLQAMEALRAPI